MTFRDDADALRARIETLERENSSLRDQIAGRPTSRSVVPLIAGAVVLLVGALVCLGGAGAAFFVRARGGAQEARQDAACEMRSAQLQQQLSEAQARLAEAEARAALGATGAARATPRRIADATVVEARGATSLRTGEACQVELHWGIAPDDSCRIWVRCGTQRPFGDVGLGWVSCEATPAGITTAWDRHPTPQGGDPMLEYQGATDRLTVSDLGPDWSVTLALSRTL